MIKLGSPHIYIAHPMGGLDVIEANVARAIDYADRVYMMGAIPHIPGLSIAWNTRHPKDYEAWMALDFAIVLRCDALARVPGASPGADREVAFAETHRIPVLRSFDEIASFLSAWTGRLGEESLS